MRTYRHPTNCLASDLAHAYTLEAEGRHEQAERLRKQATECYESRCRMIPPRFKAASTDEELGECGLYIHGPVGVGKTHLAAALASKAVFHGADMKWLSSASWLADIRASFNGGRQPEEPWWWADCDLLVIDDLGVEKVTEWSVEQIHALINEAYERETQLIVTTNLRVSDLAKRLGKRIASRLVELCDVRLIEGDDRRVQIALDRKAGEA